MSWRFAEWTTPLHEHFLTETDPALNPFFGLFEDACQSLGRTVEREIFPAGTDSRFLRALGVQAVGFSPMAATPTLLHEHNEALSVATFLEGIKAYECILPAICDATAEMARVEKPIDEAKPKGSTLGPIIKRAAFAVAWTMLLKAAWHRAITAN